MDVRDALRAIRKHWIVVLVAVLLGAAGGAYLVLSAKPKYGSSVTFFVSTPASDDASALAADQFATRRVNSYVHLASSESLANLIIKQTGVKLSPQGVAHEISASAALNTVLLTVKVVDPDAPRSLQIANSVSTQLPALISSIDTSGSTTDHIKLTVVSGPRLNPTAIRPSRATTGGLGILAGLFVGIVIAVLRELLDNTIRTQELLRTVSGLPALGVVEYDASARTEPLLVGRQVRSTRAEAFRRIRTNLQFSNVDSPARVIVVTSSIASEGKSTTSANLATVFAESGRATLLIEADMRRPRATEYMGLERSVGLSNVLAGQVEVDEVLQQWGDGRLYVLSGGTVPPNPSEILGSRGMSDLIEQMRERFDMIIIDTPPLLPVTDAAVASQHADGAVIVVRSGKTTRAQLSASVAALEAVDAPILGTILNMAKRRSGAAGRYDGYGYYEDPSNTPADIAPSIRVSSDDQATVGPEPVTPAPIRPPAEAPAAESVTDGERSGSVRR